MADSKLLAAAIDTVVGGLETTGETAGFDSDQGLIDLIPGAINVLLGFLGILAFGFIVYAGVLYLISRGEKDMVETAKKILTYSVIGMVIIIAAYAITSYLLSALTKVAS